ncbi:unnamed protein product, partial [Mesorhabditis spiculigera]
MADDKKEEIPSGSKDDELANLLDSSLKDFGKQKNTDDDLDDIMAAHDQEAARKAAADFNEMLKNMVQMKDEVFKQGEAEGGPPQEIPEDMKSMFEAIEKLMHTSGNIANAQSPEEMQQNLDMLKDPNSPLEPFMGMLMESLVSKEMMYPALKDIHDKFPEYFEKHAAELDAETKARYEKQQEVIGKLCAAYEADEASDAIQVTDVTDVVPKAEGEPQLPEGMSTIAKCLVELQTLGYPPAELVGPLPPGWQTDEQGLPKMDDPKLAAQACPIM